MNKIYHGPRDNSGDFKAIYYKPKGYHKYSMIELFVEHTKKKYKKNVENFDYHYVMKIVNDHGLPEGMEEIQLEDTPKCCRSTFDLLDNSWGMRI